MDQKKLLKVFSVLYVLLAVSNFLKPFEFSGEHGFVFLGVRLSGTANLVAGPAFGVVLAVYAHGLWHLKRFALPLGIAYALYVVVNLAMFNLRMPGEASAAPLFGLVYTLVAVGVSFSSAYLLAKNRDELS